MKPRFSRPQKTRPTTDELLVKMEKAFTKIERGVADAEERLLQTAKNLEDILKTLAELKNHAPKTFQIVADTTRLVKLITMQTAGGMRDTLKISNAYMTMFSGLVDIQEAVREKVPD